MSERVSQEQYESDFKGKERDALEHALEIRKFEIDLYWKRATYFWAFIGATFAGYGAVQASSIQSRGDLSVFLASLGTVFSFGWFCVNKGSKHWQENWEDHVDLLEDSIVGPLYKTVLKRPKPVGAKQVAIRWITGPASLSVSKINQIISLFVTFLWSLLLWRSLPPFAASASVDWEYVLIISAALAACLGFITLGRTSEGSHRHAACRRDSEISPRSVDPQNNKQGIEKP